MDILSAIQLESLPHADQTKTAPHASTLVQAEPRASGVTSHGPQDAQALAVPAEAGAGRKRANIVVIQLSAVTILGSLSSGLLTVGIPIMAADVGLPQHLIFWPLTVFGLCSGCFLLIVGSIADVVGSRLINLTGAFLSGCFILATGFSQSGSQLIALRALQGVALSLLLPTNLAILTNTIPAGKRRNVGISCLGLAQPLGYGLGLVLGGVFIGTVGWRLGYYITGAAELMFSMLGVWAIPADVKVSEVPVMRKLGIEIDWIGTGIATTSFGILAYVLANLTTGTSNIKKPLSITLLTASLALIVAFVLWMRRQEQKGKVALIPNSLWKTKAFSSVCLIVLLVYATMTAFELQGSLFFQQVQQLSALQTSLRILPSLVLGTIVNFLTGLLVHRIPAVYIVFITCLLTAGAPLLMAIINPKWPYWYDAFAAQLLFPLSSDVLYTIAFLVISNTFPNETQGLAGAVFNTVGQFGSSLGLAAIAVISTAATNGSKYMDKMEPDALLIGYKAGFWTAFAWMLAACIVCAVGLRGVGKVGLKRD